MYGLIQKSSLPADYGGEQPSMDTLTGTLSDIDIYLSLINDFIDLISV